MWWKYVLHIPAFYQSVINHYLNYKFFPTDIFFFPVSNPLYDYKVAAVYRQNKNSINKLQVLVSELP